MKSHKDLGNIGDDNQCSYSTLTDFKLQIRDDQQRYDIKSINRQQKYQMQMERNNAFFAGAILGILNVLSNDFLREAGCSKKQIRSIQFLLNLALLYCSSTFTLCSIGMTTSYLGTHNKMMGFLANSAYRLYQMSASYESYEVIFQKFITMAIAFECGMSASIFSANLSKEAINHLKDIKDEIVNKIKGQKNIQVYHFDLITDLAIVETQPHGAFFHFRRQFTPVNLLTVLIRPAHLRFHEMKDEDMNVVTHRLEQRKIIHLLPGTRVSIFSKSPNQRYQELYGHDVNQAEMTIVSEPVKTQLPTYSFSTLCRLGLFTLVQPIAGFKTAVSSVLATTTLDVVGTLFSCCYRRRDHR